jgi:hypothetical protein
MSNILDSRDLQKELDELTELRDALESAKQELDNFLSNPEPDEEDKDKWESEKESLEEAIYDAESCFGTDEKEKLAELESLADEVDEWQYGACLVNEDYWEDYCRELCTDIGDLPKDLPAYIENNIDWVGVSQDLKADYSEIQYQGETYLYRNC